MRMIPEEELDRVLNIRIIRLASKLSLIFQRETLRPAGIKVQQWRILVSLAQFGELHLRSLARHSSQDPAHTSRVVRSLISLGWVRDRPDDEDQRRIIYELTEPGVQVIETYWPKARQFAADVAVLFDEDEFYHLREMLDRVHTLCDARLEPGKDG